MLFLSFFADPAGLASFGRPHSFLAVLTRLCLPFCLSVRGWNYGLFFWRLLLPCCWNVSGWNSGAFFGRRPPRCHQGVPLGCCFFAAPWLIYRAFALLLGCFRIEFRAALALLLQCIMPPPMFSEQAALSKKHPNISLTHRSSRARAARNSTLRYPSSKVKAAETQLAPKAGIHLRVPGDRPPKESPEFHPNTLQQQGTSSRQTKKA